MSDRQFGSRCGPICKADNLIVTNGNLRRMPYLFGLVRCTYCDIVMDYFGDLCPCCRHKLKTRPYNLKRSFYTSAERKIRYEQYLRFKRGEIDFKQLLEIVNSIDSLEITTTVRL